MLKRSNFKFERCILAKSMHVVSNIRLIGSAQVIVIVNLDKDSLDRCCKRTEVPNTLLVTWKSMI